MKKIELDNMENVIGGTNGALCFAAGLGIFIIGGPLTIFGLASLGYATKCWNS